MAYNAGMDETESEEILQPLASVTGRAKSGAARMAKLTPEEKTELAKKAAEARWGAEDGTKKVYVTDHFGIIEVGATQIECAVLDRQIRVLSERELVRAFGAKRGGAHWRRKAAGAEGADLPVILSAGNLQRFIDDDLRAELKQRFLYKVKGKDATKTAFGMKAELLPLVCEVYLKAQDEEKRTNKSVLIGGQVEIARAAEILVRSLAKVGIVALVDEATGFQRERDRDALQEFLRELIGSELAKWEKKFPQEFYKQTFRLKGWRFDANSTRRPMQMAQITAEYIYRRLGPEVLEELRRLSPKDESGRRKNKLFQWFTADVGHPALDRQLEKCIIVATASRDWESFKEGMDRVSPDPNKTPRLDFDA